MYYVLPGGGVEPGESPEDAAVREAAEELGVGLVILGRVATIGFRSGGHHSQQHYFAAEIVQGEFGSGTGPEYAENLDSSRGTYHPTWLSLADAASRTVHPRALLEALRTRGVEDLTRAPLRAIEIA